MIFYSIQIISAFGIIAAFLLFLFLQKNEKKNEITLHKSKKKNPTYAILIPAREESKVIENLLKSLQKQTKKVDGKDIYVIVEKKEDPTTEICKKYQVNCFIRQKLEFKSKGYALMEVVEQILKEKKKYDAYFIFDADNVLAKNYLEEMTKTYQEGYDIACGYRALKNGNDSVVAAASGLMFSIINTIMNQRKKENFQNITFSGTGFFIRGSLIEEWGTYPFHTLTEDYELSLYATLHNLATTYNPSAIYYDEQPLYFKETIPQRTRWIKGYFTNFLKYHKPLRKKMPKACNYGSVLAEYLGVLPIAFLVFGLILSLIACFFASLYFTIKTHQILSNLFLFSCGYLLLIYLALVLFTYLIMKIEGPKLQLNKKMKKKVLFYHPLFLASYIYVFFVAIFKSEVIWTKVEHRG